MPIISLSNPTARSHYSVTYFKRRWSDDWVQAEDAVATDVKWAVSPDLSEATIRVRFGWRLDKSNPHVAPMDRTGWLVKILDVQSGANFDTVIRKWYGYVVVDGIDESGVRKQGNDYIESGFQTMRCIGLEDLLYRTTVITSEFWITDAQYTAERGLTFNRRGAAGQVEPNRTSSTNPAPLFEGDPEADPQYWSSRTIVEYLLYYHVPQDAAGNRNIIFDISGQELAKIPKDDRPELRTHGETVGNLLNQVVNRYRQMTWWCELNESNNHIDVKLARLHPDPILLPSSSELMNGNSTQYDVNTFGDPSVRVRTNAKASQLYHQFIYQGALRRHCFNLNTDRDDSVGEEWKSAIQASYDAGGSGAAGYPASTEPRDRAAFDRRVRASEELRDVYSRFGFKKKWNQKAGNGMSGTTPVPIAEKIVSSGPFGSQQYVIYPPDMRFCPTLPLFDNTTYQGQSASDFGNAVGNKPFEEQRPVCFMRTDTDLYIDITKIGMNADQEVLDFAKDFRWSARVSVDQSGRAMRCEINGADQYVIAGGHYSPLAHDEYTPRTNYESFIWLVGVYDDRRCEGRYPADEDLATMYPNTDALARYVVYLGDDYRQDDVLPHTNVAVDQETGDLTTTFGGDVRNDAGKLFDLARMSFEWYATPRRSLTIQTANDDPQIKLGVYVPRWQLDDEGNFTRDVNSVITQITRTFPIGTTNPPQMSTMTFTTSFEQFDPVKL